MYLTSLWGGGGGCVWESTYTHPRNHTRGRMTPPDPSSGLCRACIYPPPIFIGRHKPMGFEVERGGLPKGVGIIWGCQCATPPSRCPLGGQSVGPPLGGRVATHSWGGGGGTPHGVGGPPPSPPPPPGIDNGSGGGDRRPPPPPTPTPSPPPQRGGHGGWIHKRWKGYIFREAVGVCVIPPGVPPPPFGG